MSTLTPEVAAKLDGDDLRRLAELESDQIVSVILELALPHRQIDVTPDPSTGRNTFGWANGQADLDVAGTSARLRDAVHALTGRPVVELPAARALTTHLNGRQLAEVAELEGIRSIRENTRHVWGQTALSID